MDWIQELMMALSLYAQVKALKDQGASGEIDLAVTATVKTTGQQIALPDTIKVQL